MERLAFVFRGDTRVDVCDDDFVLSTLVVAYHAETDCTFYGLIAEYDGGYVFASMPCDPVLGWQLVQGSDGLERARYVRALTKASKGSLFADTVEFTNAIKLAIENLSTPCGDYPPPTDAVEMWDSLPSARMRSALMEEYQRAMNEGRLEKAPSIVSRFAEFTDD